MNNRTLHVDLETAASRDLRKVGVFEYVKCPDFMVTVAAWAWDDGPVQSIVWPATAQPLPNDIMIHIAEGGAVHAWNATFERVILETFYAIAADPSAMVCTMQRALAFGLPAALGEAGPALGLGIIKDVSAHSLMMRMGKPRKDGTWYHKTDPAKLAALEAYCRRDVEAEREVGRHIPMLTEFEKRVSWIDAWSNARGVAVDETAVRILAKAQAKIKNAIHSEVSYLTSGAVVKVESEVKKLMAWLAANHCPLPNVSKEEVEKALATLTKFKGLHETARRVLELRQMASKSSLGKLDAMLRVRGADGRARGLLQYYGAGRTGRWAGRMIQVQNLPRNKSGLDPDALLETVVRGSDGLEMFYEKPLDALSECLRGCLTAQPGKMLAMVDLSQIEARVVAWLAGQDDILQVFRDGKEDVYDYAARKIGSSDRQLGKVVTLACGFQMGAARFQETAADYGIAMGYTEAVTTVSDWRAANPRIVQYWYDIDRAAGQAISRPGTIETVRNVRIRVRDGKLLIKKPSGGVLVYHKPRLEDGDIVFDGVDQYTKKWSAQKTYGGKLVENITQSTARDIIAEALVRVEKYLGLIPVMTIHDEVVYEIEQELGAKTIQILVEEMPGWAAGLPVASKLHVAFRFGK